MGVLEVLFQAAGYSAIKGIVSFAEFKKKVQILPSSLPCVALIYFLGLLCSSDPIPNPVT